MSNGSDDDLLTLIDASLGCTPWEVPLQDPGRHRRRRAAMTTAGPLEEVQAALMQPAPQALVPGLDPFVTLNGKPDLFLQDLYRAQVGQPLTFNDQDTNAYCQNLAAAGVPRLKTDAAAEAGLPAPPFAMIGTNLATVLAARFAATWANLTCPALTGNPSPITVTTDGNGMAVSASLNGTQYTGQPAAGCCSAGHDGHGHGHPVSHACGHDCADGYADSTGHHRHDHPGTLTTTRDRNRVLPCPGERTPACAPAQTPACRQACQAITRGKNGGDRGPGRPGTGTGRYAFRLPAYPRRRREHRRPAAVISRAPYCGPHAGPGRTPASTSCSQAIHCPGSHCGSTGTRRTGGSSTRTTPP